MLQHEALPEEQSRLMRVESVLQRHSVFILQAGKASIVTVLEKTPKKKAQPYICWLRLVLAKNRKLCNYCSRYGLQLYTFTSPAQGVGEKAKIHVLASVSAAADLSRSYIWLFTSTTADAC